MIAKSAATVSGGRSRLVIPSRPDRLREQNRMISLLGIRYDGSSSFERGAAEGPPAVRAGLKRDSTNSWTESGFDVFAPGVLDDAGDIEPGPGEAGRRSIEEAVAAV